MLRKRFSLSLLVVVVLMAFVLTGYDAGAATAKPGEVTLTLAARAGAMGDALTESA